MAAINLLLVLLSTTEAASLLIERAGLATVVPSVTDLLLVLL
jgi:hypothetical protein